MKIIKKIFQFSLIFVGISILAIIWSDYKIKSESKDFVTSDIKSLPNQKVGLLLGTSKTLSNGNPNLYFENRIKAATDLYKSGKIQNIIVSGDNSRKSYNESEDMKLALIANGIPENRIYEDFAGLRTLDSVIRAKEIFGQNSFIIISQKFHNERAVFLARKNNIEAFGYNAKDVNRYAGLKTNAREKLARVKVFVDLLLDIKPKYKGESITIL